MTPIYDKITQALKSHAEQDAQDTKLFAWLLRELDPDWRGAQYKVDGGRGSNSAIITTLTGAAICYVEVGNGRINILTKDRHSAVTVKTVDEATTEVADRIAAAMQTQEHQRETMQSAYGT